MPLENGVKEANERKKTWYSELATEAAWSSWKIKTFPVVVGCRGFVATSMKRPLKKMLVSCHSLHQAIMSLPNAAEY